MQIGVESSRAVENKRVFVIDSDEITRAVLQFMLHDENETHEIASVALAYEEAREWLPDVILLGMPIVLARGVARKTADHRIGETEGGRPARTADFIVHSGTRGLKSHPPSMYARSIATALGSST